MALDTGSQLAFKWAGQRVGPGSLDLAWLGRALVTPGLWVGVGCYVGTLLVWMQVLQRMDLSRAFPITGISYVTVPALAVVLFRESLTSMQLAGIAAICAGVALLAFDKE
jgi:multidrug transporter EmrE-like cation transporter